MKKACDLLFVLLLAIGFVSCSKVIRHSPGVRVEIGPAGGRIKLDEALLEIPAGALQKKVEIGLSIDDAAPNGTIGYVYDLRPRDLQFEIPAILHIGFIRGQLPGNVGDGDLSIAELVDNRWKYILDSTISVKQSEVVASIAYLSRYGLITKPLDYPTKNEHEKLDGGSDAHQKDDLEKPPTVQCECETDFECDDGDPCIDSRCIDSCYCASLVVAECETEISDTIDREDVPIINRDIEYEDILNNDLIFNQPTLSAMFGRLSETEYGYVAGLNPTNGEVVSVVRNINYPSGLAFDQKGNLYFGNVTLPKIALELYRMAPDGEVTLLKSAEDTSQAAIALGGWAFDLAVTPNGEVCFNVPKLSSIRSNSAGVSNGAIKCLSPNDGQVSIAVDNLEYPSGLAFDLEGNLYFGNVTLPKIALELYRMAPDGEVTLLKSAEDTSQAAIALGGWAFDLAVAPNGEVCFNVPKLSSIGNNSEAISNGAIKCLSPNDGQVSIAVDNLEYPSGLAFDLEGNLYFGNVTLPKIALELYRMAPDGEITQLKSAEDTSQAAIALGGWAFDVTAIRNF